MDTTIDANATEVQICGFSFSLVGLNLPNSVTVQHSFDESLNEMSRKGKNKNECDVTIVIGEKKVHARKDLLSERIPFFRDLFNSKMIECINGVVNLSSNFCEFDLLTIERLLDYARTGVVVISTENVQDLLLGASFLRIDSVIEECAEFIRRRLTVDNIFQLFFIFKTIEYHKIDSYLFSFFDKNFVFLSFSQEFLHLSIDDLLTILKRDSLNVESETQVFNAISRWIDFDMKRRRFAPELLECISCSHFPIDFMSDIVEKSEWMIDSYECRAIIEEAKNKKKQTNYHTFTDRICNDAHLLFLAFRPANECPNDFCYQMYDPLTNIWTELKNIPISHSIFNIGWERNQIILFREMGKESNETFLEPYAVIDTITNEWVIETMDIERKIQKNPWHVNKVRKGSTTEWIDGFVYMVGGWDNDYNIISSLDAYEIRSNVWKKLSPMNCCRYNPCSVELDGKIYVIGGQGEDEPCFNTGECYDPKTDRWSPIKPMKWKRTGFAAVAIKKKIYVAGGYDGEQILKTVERYDPFLDEWTTLKSMTTERFGHCSGDSGGKWFVFGGTDTDGVSNGKTTVEMYDPETNVWEQRRQMKHRSICLPLKIPTTFPTPASNLENIWSSEFRRFQLKDELIKAIVECGFMDPTTIQSECIPPAIRGEDVMCENDSKGKTSSYVISTLHNLEPIDGIISITILVPNREMASSVLQKYQRFSKYLKPIKICELVGAVPIKKNMKSLQNECPHIVVGTPIRIAELIKNGALKINKIQQLVLDGCDRMIGETNMRKAIKKIFESTARHKQILSYGVTTNKTKQILQDYAKRSPLNCR